MKKLLVLLLIATQAWAGLPPTTTQGQGDASPKTKFAFQAPNHQITDLGGVKALIETGNNDVLLNPEFQASTADSGWSHGTGVTDATDATVKNDSNQASLKVTIPAAFTGDVFYQDVTVSNVSGVPEENSFYVYNSGNVANLQVCPRLNGTTLTGGSNCQSVPLGGSWFSVPASTVGGSGTTSIGVSLYASASTSGNVWLTHAYTGKTRLIGTVQQNNWVGSVTTPITASCLWSTTSTTYANFAAVSACPVATASGNVSAPATKIPGVTLNNLAPGHYHLVATSVFQSDSTGTAAQHDFTISDGTSQSGHAIANINVAAQSNPLQTQIVGDFTYTTPQTSVTFQIQGSTSNAAVASDVNNASYTIPFNIQVFYYPSQSQTVASLATAAQSWSGTQVGAGGGWTTTSATYADFSVATTSNTVTQVTSRNMVCTAESTKLPAITCPLTGGDTYFISATPSAYNATASSPVYARMVDGSGQIVNGGVSFFSNSTGQQAGLPLFGIYTAASSGGNVTFKLQGENNGSGTATVQQNSASPITWSVVDISRSMPQPYTTGNVSSRSAGQKYAEDVTVATNASTSCGTLSLSGDYTGWISCSTYTGAGDVTYALSGFSGSPQCTCSVFDSSAYSCEIVTQTSTALRIREWSIGTTPALVNGSGAGYGYNLHCSGPH